MKNNWTKKDLMMAKRYPKLAARAIKNNERPTNQALIEMDNAVFEYEDMYIVGGIDILTGKAV